MASEPNESYRLFGAKALLKRLQNLVKEIEGVRKAEDIEYVHRMRVASRRIRSALALFKECLPAKSSKRWNKQMRRVTRALGDARDVDVQIDFVHKFLDSVTEPRHRPGIQRFLLRLRQKREGLQGAVVEAMDQLELSGVLEDMGGALRQIRVYARMRHVDEHSPCVYEQAYLAISFRLENMLAYEPYVSQPDRQEELHAMRIAAKRLRYTMEVFEPLYKGDLKQPIKMVRNVQTLLGDIHDCDVWVEYLPQFLEEERERTLEYYGHTKAFGRLRSGILYLQKERQEQRAKIYQEFVEFWQQLHDQNFWDSLLEKISRPMEVPLNSH